MHRNQRGAANTGLIVTIVIAALIAAGAVTYMMVSSGGPSADPQPSASPSASLTPSASATPTPTATATPSAEPSASPSPSTAPAKLAIVSLTPADQSPSGCTDTVGTVDVTFRWTTTGAAHVYFGIRTDNAKAAPHASDLAANGSIVVEYPCGFGSELYTLTIEGADGTLLHRSATLLN